MTGTYVAARPSLATTLALQAWAKLEGIQLNDDLHVTILYSRVDLDVPTCWQDQYAAQPLTLGPLGDAALVLKLFSPELSRRHCSLINLGHTHDFEDYTPHITLMSKGEVPARLRPFEQRLIFHREYVESLNDE